MADLKAPATSADEVRRIADEVLARPEFADAQPTWWQRFLRLLSDFIAGVVDAVGGGGRGSVIGTLLIATIAITTVVVVLRYTRSLRRDPRLELGLHGDIGRTSRDWLAEANEHEARGAWREALRCRYRALLADLAAAGLVEEIAGRTTGEYLAAVNSDVPAATASFTEVTRRFETAWYGAGDVGADDVAAFRDAARRTRVDAGIPTLTAARA